MIFGEAIGNDLGVALVIEAFSRPHARTVKSSERARAQVPLDVVRLVLAVFRQLKQDIAVQRTRIRAGGIAAAHGPAREPAGGIVGSDEHVATRVPPTNGPTTNVGD